MLQWFCKSYLIWLSWSSTFKVRRMNTWLNFLGHRHPCWVWTEMIRKGHINTSYNFNRWPCSRSVIYEYICSSVWGPESAGCVFAGGGFAVGVRRVRRSHSRDCMPIHAPLGLECLFDKAKVPNLQDGSSMKMLHMMFVERHIVWCYIDDEDT